MLSLFVGANAFSAPTVHVAQPVVRSSPVQMMAEEMPSRRAAMLSAASLLALPLAAQAKPEDYVGGYTTKDYAKTFASGKAKCFSSGAGAPDACEGPGGSPKDPLISRPSAFDKIDKPIPVVTTSVANAKKA